MNAGLVVRPATIVSRALLVSLLLGGLLGVGPAAVAAAPVDQVPPDTFFTMGPSPTITPGPVFFEFGSSEPGRFECAMDGVAWSACTSPFATTATATGPHTLAVVAIDAAGNLDPTPATYGFTIVPAVLTPATVSTRAVARKRRLRVDVQPDWAAGDYALTVQRLTGRTWRTAKRTTTRGAADTRTLDLRRGAYRVLVAPASGLAGATSATVRLRR